MGKNHFFILFLAASTIVATPALVQGAPTKAGDWVVRARVLGVMPQEDATIDGAVTGSTISIDNSVVPEWLSYQLKIGFMKASKNRSVK